MLFVKKQRRVWPYILLAIVAVWIAAGLYAFAWWQKNGVTGILEHPDVKRELAKEFGDHTDFIVRLAPRFLGFPEPKTILILFLNNTELRPGGGFIGAYSTVRIDRGRIEILAVEGTEQLDRRAPPGLVEPPAPIKKYLGTDRWYFRDSNWSPDFRESAKQALALYRAEEGVGADDIDIVLGVTPTVLEELLRITGPLTIDGLTFDADTVTEALEYEVEYGYRDRGISLQERKKILESFMKTLMDVVARVGFTDIPKHVGILRQLIREKHILAYAPDETVQSIFVAEDLAGEVTSSAGDYLLWVDANMGALKTDHAIERSLSYTLESFDRAMGGWASWRGTAAMTYRHTGSFDWRTSRYRTYARVYVPKGAVLEDAAIIDGKGKRTPIVQTAVDRGEEGGQQWFGTFTTIEPGDTETLVFVYRMPTWFTETMQKRLYTLAVQKQPGVTAFGLTLALDFGTPITAAEPAEQAKEWGDTIYRLQTTTKEDMSFTVHW